jgi:hypothetical protein
MKRMIWKVIEPRFEELSVFLLGLSFFGLLPFDAELRSLCRTTFQFWDGAGNNTFIWILIAGFGFLAAFLECLRKGKVPSGGEEFFLWSGVTLSLLIGLNACSHSLPESYGLLMIFPIWNFVAAFTPIWLLYYVEQENLSADYDASLLQVIVGGWLVLVILYFCAVVLGLHWSFQLLSRSSTVKPWIR